MQHLREMPPNVLNGLGLKPYQRFNKQACRFTNNLYNEANFCVRQEFFKTGTWVQYGELYTELKYSVNYDCLPAPTAQQILRLVDHD